jgi:hypothetical protein
MSFSCDCFEERAWERRGVKGGRGIFVDFKWNFAPEFVKETAILKHYRAICFEAVNV